jgi:hypothetical protein
MISTRFTKPMSDGKKQRSACPKQTSVTHWTQGAHDAAVQAAIIEERFRILGLLAKLLPPGCSDQEARHIATQIKSPHQKKESI